MELRTNARVETTKEAAEGGRGQIAKERTVEEGVARIELDKSGDSGG